jgi:hypothetical protein
MGDWARIAAGAATDAGAVPAELLGDFLPGLAGACASGARLDRHQLAAHRALGARAADDGVALAALIDLYLSAAWRAWRLLPAVAGEDAEAVRVAGEVVLHAVDDAVAAVADGFHTARRVAVRLEESARREFVDDLLAGTGDPVAMLARSERFGLDPTGPHMVAVVHGVGPVDDSSPLVSHAASLMSGSFVTTRHGSLVVVVPAGAAGEAHALINKLSRALLGADGPSVGVGRTQAGVAGIAQSYAEAGDVLQLASRLGLAGPVVRADQLLVYRVLLRDRPVLMDLIEAVLAPLRAARGGITPLFDTIDAHLATGGNTTATARRLHLSARAVTYRLRRIHELTGHDPANPDDRFVLQVALLGARALGWPDHPADDQPSDIRQP